MDLQDGPGQAADVERRVRAALTDRTGEEAILGLVGDPWHDQEVVVHLDSRETALDCEQQLRAAGYVCAVLPPAAADRGVWLRVSAGDATDSDLFRTARTLRRGFCPAPYDGDFSATFMPILRPLVPPHPGYPKDLFAFVVDHQERLQRLYDRCAWGGPLAQSRRYILARQPEGLIVLHQLHTARHALHAAFEHRLEARYVTDLARAWGTRL